MTRTWLSGDWFKSFSGAELVAENPNPADIRLEDIAHHLSMVCRFGGACPVFYSVASHSMYVAELMPPGLRIEGLLHDASEAYLGDMIKCVKRLCPDYRVLEDTWTLAIRERFGLRPHPEPAVKDMLKRADIAALLAERRDVFSDRTQYDEIATAGEAVCVPLDPASAELAFLAYADRLGLS